MAKFDDGMMLTLGVVGVVAAAGAVVGRRGSRDTVYDPQHRQRINKDEILKTLPAPPNGTAWRVKKLIRRPNMGEYGFELDLDFANPRKYIAPYIYYSNDRGEGWYWSYYFMTRSENTSVPARDVFRVLTQGHFGSGFTSPSAAAAAMLKDLERSTTNLFDEKPRGSRAKTREGYDAPHGLTHVVVNKADMGLEVFGPLEKSEADRVSKIFGADDEVEDSSVYVANIVALKDGSWAVVAEHDDGSEKFEVIYGFFKTQRLAEAWMNRQPEEETMTDMFVSKVFKPRV